MALLDDNTKANFDTTLIANFDENGDGTSLNPQPLNVDGEGNLIVGYINGGSISIISGTIGIDAYMDNGGNKNVHCDNNGALNQGGVNISNTIDLQAFSQGGEYSNYLLAYAGIQTLRMQLIADVQGHGYNKMYNYTENITTNSGSGNFYVFVSCYGGN